MTLPQRPSSQPILQRASGGAPILDYACPHPRGRFRLPAQSDLRVTSSPQELRVRETLRGKLGAFGALVFGAFTLFCIASVPFVEFSAKHWRRHLPADLVCSMVALAEIVTMFAVIDSTWRETILTVTPPETTLRFRSPIRGTTRHRWATDQIRSVQVRHRKLETRQRVIQRYIPELAELEIDVWNGPPAQLFLGHDDRELNGLVDAIDRIQATPQTPSLSPASH
jgi:hypothetical protein